MRVVWIVGGDASSKRKLEASLSLERTGHDYVVHSATSIEEIPVQHMEHPSVTALLDAFHPALPGFEGLKALRREGFAGPIYLFGEPSPDLAVEPFQKFRLTGYFPSFAQSDFNFVGGMIHSQYYFTGELDLGLFLLPTGRHSIETIRTFRDFNAYGAKLASFICRFGIDIAQLKKVMMGLCLGHIKTTSGSPMIEQPFTIAYGIDPAKVVLAVSTFTRGSTKEFLLSDFGEVLDGLKNPKASPGTVFPELYHTSRASENLVVFGGSAKSTDENMDPMVLMTALAFPSVNEKRQAPFSVFAFVQVKQTPEINEENVDEAAPAIEESSETEISAAPLVETHEVEKEEELAPPPPQAESAPSLSGAVPEMKEPTGMIQGSQVTEILEDEPLIVGDAPTTVNEVRGSEGEASQIKFGSTPEEAQVPETNTLEVEQFKQKLRETESELARLKEVSAAMGQDVRRLMKERRQPTTDRELRDAVTQMEEKLKNLVQDKQRAYAELEDKKNQIKTLQAQVETLRMKAA